MYTLQRVSHTSREILTPICHAVYLKYELFEQCMVHKFYIIKTKKLYGVNIQILLCNNLAHQSPPLHAWRSPQMVASYAAGNPATSPCYLQMPLNTAIP